MIIISAGLSGLYPAKLVEEHYNLRILEERDRVAGRTLGIERYDLEPSWA